MNDLCCILYVDRLSFVCSETNMSLLTLLPHIYYDDERDVFFATKKRIEATKPLSICIRVTRYCNLQCLYCLSSSGPGLPRGNLAIIEDVLNVLNVFAPIRIVFSGGEPLLFPHLVTILSLSKSIGNVNVVSTNATLSPKTLVDIFEYVNWYDISLHGYDRESYAKARGLDLFDKVVENIKILVRMNAYVCINYLLHKENYMELQKALNLFTQLNVSKVRLDHVLRIGYATEIDIADSLTDYMLDYIEKVITQYEHCFKKIIPPARYKKPYLVKGYIAIEEDGSSVVDSTKFLLPRDFEGFSKKLTNIYRYHYELFLDNWRP